MNEVETSFSNLEEEELLEITGGDVKIGPMQGPNGMPGFGISITK